MRQSQGYLTISQSTFAFSGSQDIPHSRESARVSAKRSAAQLLHADAIVLYRDAWIPPVDRATLAKLSAQHSSATAHSQLSSAWLSSVP